MGLVDVGGWRVCGAVAEAEAEPEPVAEPVAETKTGPEEVKGLGAAPGDERQFELGAMIGLFTGCGGGGVFEEEEEEEEEVEEEVALVEAGPAPAAKGLRVGGLLDGTSLQSYS